MKNDGNITEDFNLEAGGELPPTPFCAYLERNFDRETALKVAGVFQRMGLPLPQGVEEYMEGTEGALVFLNPYGLVIRIEHPDSALSAFKADRINDSPWILQPLASLTAGQAVIEVCPGCHYNDNSGDVGYLHEALLKEGHAFWDGGLPNVGRLPVKTPQFPEGIPVVIDRLSVRKLSESLKGLRQALDAADDEAREATEAQERLYAPLRQAFDEGWSESGKMPLFWALCLEGAQGGALAAGWNEARSFEPYSKTREAIEKAKGYAKRLETSSGASTGLQSPRPPA